MPRRPRVPPALTRVATSPWLWGGLFVFTGTMHFLKPEGFERIVPPPLPPGPTVALSGLAEAAGGVGLMVPQTRRAASWGLVALLAAVFPANVYAALHPETMAWAPVWSLWARLPAQFPMMGLVYLAGRRKRGAPAG